MKTIGKQFDVVFYVHWEDLDGGNADGGYVEHETLFGAMEELSVRRKERPDIVYYVRKDTSELIEEVLPEVKHA